jgi:ATP-binding cassette, subfamily F, member 3
MTLRLEGLAKSFGGRSLFEGVSLEVGPGDRLGLVGPNGAGKTTLLRIAAGCEEPAAGQRLPARGARIGWLRREIDPTRAVSVREETASALAELAALERELRELESRIAEEGRAGREPPRALAERYDALHHRFGHAGGFEREARVEQVLAGLGFSPEARERPLSSFSGGWLMRVELAKLLLTDPDVLLLDEPTNHLDLPSIAWFEETLEEFRGGVIVISHDRTFLRRHATRMAELAHGRFTVYEGGFDRYLAERERRRAELLARQRTQERQIAETERFIERFRAKASKARQVQSRIRALDKLERIEATPERRRRMRLRIPEPPRAGAVPIALEGIHKRYGSTIVYRGIDLAIRRTERVALVGPNGAGKSTLLRILAGVLPFDEGRRVLGHQAEIAFYAQHQLEALAVDRTVLQELEAVARVDDVPRLRGHLGAFLFSGDDVDKKVSVLSGGEKARLALARMLLRPANVLVMDEPTNHLDIDACEVLEEALAAFRGTLVFISHDRAFIDGLATRILEVREGQLRDFPGGYAHYAQWLDEEAGRGPMPAPARSEGPRPGAASTGGSVPQAGHARERERRKLRQRTVRQVQQLEARILEKESQTSALAWRLGDPQIYRDPDRLRGLEAEREALQAEIDALYRDWERLATEMEALGSSET